MKATITRTLQAPQYAPITMTLEEECTPETFVLTLNKLADLIENTLRERYPKYAGVLPIVQKKEVVVKQNHSLSVVKRELIWGIAEKKPDKVITRLKGAALVECINNCTSLEKLQSYEKDLDTTEAEIAYNDKFMELGTELTSPYSFPK